MLRSAGDRIVARCVVCKGDIHQSDEHEVWEGGFYCMKHSVTYLRRRAEEYGRLLAERESHRHS
jgi:hypothetical protein